MKDSSNQFVTFIAINVAQMLQLTIYVRIFLSDLLCHNFETLTVFGTLQPMVSPI